MKVLSYLQNRPQKTKAEMDANVDWCIKMLARVKRYDTEGMFRWHWVLIDSLEMFCDIKQHPYLGPKKALKWMEKNHPSAFVCYKNALDNFSINSLNSVYTRSGQNSTPNSNATNLHSSQKRCCSFCISSSNASPTFQVQKSIFHQMTKPIQVTVILPLLLAISFSRNDDIHSSISGISNDLIGVIPTIGQ